MRYVLGFCAVLVIGNLAWTSEVGTIAGEPGYQTPAATVTSSLSQATGTPIATTPGGVVQTMTGQPAATTSSAPGMMSPGTYTAGSQPAGTYYVNPVTNTAYTQGSYPGYTTYSSPTTAGYTYPPTTGYAYSAPTGYTYSPTTGYSSPMVFGRGLFGRRWMNNGPMTPVTTTYATYTSTPGQTYYYAPGQNYYSQPVQPRMGLFRRWRQNFMPMNSAPVYGTPTYSTAPVYTSYGYSTPANYTTTPANFTTTTYSAPTTTYPAGTVLSDGTVVGNTAPANYTPTTLNAPGGTPTATAPAEPPLQGTSPALPATSQPSSVPSVIPRIPR